MFKRMLLKRVSGAVQRLENATKKQSTVAIRNEEKLRVYIGTSN